MAGNIVYVPDDPSLRLVSLLVPVDFDATAARNSYALRLPCAKDSFKNKLIGWISRMFEYCKLYGNIVWYCSMYVCLYVWSAHIAEYGSTG